MLSQFLKNERRQSDMENIIEIPEGYEARIDGNKVILESKESEDERIKKAIKSLIIASEKNGTIDGVIKEHDALVWLERQGDKQKLDGAFVNVDDVRENFVNEVYRVLDSDPNNDRANQIIDAFDSLPTLELEKQGSQNLANSAKTCKIEPKFKVGDKIKYVGESDRCAEKIITIRNDAYYFSEVLSLPFVEQDKWELAGQNPADKVKPKFKVGDWIVSYYNNATQIKAIYKQAAQIRSIDEKNYFLSCNDGNSERLSIDCINIHWRLWTIQDAKDGDILAEHETIVLFKKIEGQNIRCYCTYHYLGYNPALRVDTLQNKTPYRPATKEQCDLLFQKMKEAGYEWDAEKKELKKIEPKFKVGDWVTDGKEIGQIIKWNHPDFIGYKTNHGTEKAFYKEYISKWHRWAIQDAKDGDVLATLDYILIFKKLLPKDGGVSYCHYDFGSGNPQFIWSEDKNWYFGKEATIHPATKEQRDLLFRKMREAGYEWDVEKKELVKIEQNPAWSEEDEQEFNVMKSELENYIMLKQYGTPLSVNDIEWFKSLKERYTWKPSDEQIAELKWVKEDIGGKSRRVLDSLYNDLKKLKE